MEKRGMSDKNKSVIATFSILVFAVALFFFLFFSTNLFNSDASNQAQIRKIEKQLDNIEIPDIPEVEFVEDNVPDTMDAIENVLKTIPGPPQITNIDTYDFIAHPLHPSFAEPYDFDVGGRAVSVSDDIIYNTGYYSVNGAAWQPFQLQGTPYGNGQPWLLDDGSSNLPSAIEGEGVHYVIVFSCSLVNNGAAWDCHGDTFDNAPAKWQLYIISNGDPGCIPNCNGKVCGDDNCGGSCPPGCSGSTPRCSGGQCVANPSTGGAIITGHNAANDFEDLPNCWIEEAKRQFDIGFEGASHGSQVVNGLHGIGVSTGNFKFHDNTMGLDCSLREGAIYSPTKSYLDSHSNINVIIWSWCAIGPHEGQDVDRYLNDMDRLISEYPNVKFVFMTGHLEGTGPSGSAYTANNQIRSHVSAVNGILYDFADIESYNPDGVPFPNEDEDCDWCVSWCSSHPNDIGCGNSIYCAHSGGSGREFNCYRKGQAAWWMLARMAGWDGTAGDACP